MMKKTTKAPNMENYNQHDTADNQRHREDVIQWITERLHELPLGYIYQVRGFVRGFYESEEVKA